MLVQINKREEFDGPTMRRPQFDFVMNIFTHGLTVAFLVQILCLTLINS